MEKQELRKELLDFLSIQIPLELQVEKILGIIAREKKEIIQKFIEELPV